MKTPTYYAVGLATPVLPLCPNKPISLLDIMRQFHLQFLEQLMGDCSQCVNDLSAKPIGYILTASEVSDLKRIFFPFENRDWGYESFFERLGWENAADRLGELAEKLGKFKEGDLNRGAISAESVSYILVELGKAIDDELNSRKCVILDAGKCDYFEHDTLFGPDVMKRFPSARLHIKSAGNCIAADLNTAAIYHLMCVVEIGLRGLANHLKVKTVKKNTPIELGTWEEIIVRLENKVSSLKMLPRGKKREESQDFYNEVLKEFRSFKDLWRNKVMHVRVTYDFYQAQSAFDHVKAFMQRLATRVSETN